MQSISRPLALGPLLRAPFCALQLWGLTQEFLRALPSGGAQRSPLPRLDSRLPGPVRTFLRGSSLQLQAEVGVWG